MMRPGNGFQECQIGSWRGRAITFDDQTHFDTTPPDLNRNVAPDYQFRGVHHGLPAAVGYRHFERYADDRIAQVDALDQGSQGLSDFDFRLQALSPSLRHREDGRKAATSRGFTCADT